VQSGVSRASGFAKIRIFLIPDNEDTGVGGIEGIKEYYLASRGISL